MNDDVKYDLSTLKLKNGEQLEEFHGRILRLQQEIILSGEIVSPTRLLLQYMRELSKSDKVRDFIAPNITDIITLLKKTENLLYITDETLMESIVI